MQFRREHPFGPYIVDFGCVERMMVVELDGAQHEDQRTRDEARTRWLAGHGFRVLRFSDRDALMETEGVLESRMSERQRLSLLAAGRHDI